MSDNAVYRRALATEGLLNRQHNILTKIVHNCCPIIPIPGASKCTPGNIAVNNCISLTNIMILICDKYKINYKIKNSIGAVWTPQSINLGCPYLDLFKSGETLYIDITPDSIM